MAGKFDSIVFDFDGVIVDSFAICHGVTNQFVGQMEAERYRDFFLGNIYETLARKDIAFPKELEGNYFEVYRKEILNHPVVPGMEAVIDALSKEARLHIVSSCRGDILNEYLVKRGLNRYFDKVLGYEIEKSKQKKFAMLGAAQHVFVTDTLGDLLEAQQAGIPSIAVSWGFHGQDRLMRAPSLAIVHSPEELLRAIVTS